MEVLLFHNQMGNEMNTAKFLETIDTEAKTLVLTSIANHYGITAQEAFEEVTDTEAEHLLDYMNEPYRAATSVLMQKHGFR